MANNFKWICIIAIVIVGAGIGGMFYGKLSAEYAINTRLVNNQLMIKKIAEMASLSSTGIVRYNYSTRDTTEGFIALLKNAAMEKTITLEAPYKAKYGCNLDNGLKITFKHDEFYVLLPKPTLLSYELKIDSAEITEKKGLLVFESNEDMKKMYGKLLQEGKAAAASQENNLEAARTGIAELMSAYLSTSGKQVHLHFADDKPFTPSPFTQ